MKLSGGLSVEKAQKLVQAEAGSGADVRVKSVAYDPAQDAYMVLWEDGKSAEKYQALVSDPSDPDAVKKAAEAKPCTVLAVVWFNDGEGDSAVEIASEKDAANAVEAASGRLVQFAKAK